jgi:hypothetical protein
MNANIKEKFKAILYYMLVILAVHITGCRSNSGTIEDGGDNTSVLTPPSSVAGVVDTITKIDVSWSNTSFPELEKVILEYKKATQNNFTEVDVAKATNHSIESLEPNTDYKIRLKSVASDGDESDYSDEITVNTSIQASASCPVSEGLDATVISPTQVQLSWTWSTSNYSEMDNYLVQRKLTSSSAWTDVQNIVVNGAPAITYMDNAAAAGEIHYRLVSDCNETTYNSNNSDAVTALTALPVPVITTIADYGSYNRVNFNYTADGLNGHNGFQAEYTVYGLSPTTTSVTYVPSITYKDVTPTGCSNGNSVTYRIRATRANLLQSSDWSAPFQVICP